MAEGELKLRMTLLKPPPGVRYSLQRGDDEIFMPVTSTGDDLSMDLSVKVAEGPQGPRFLGPFIRREGPRRFVYFRVGQLAGQADSPWTRRGKLWLEGFAPGQLEDALASGRTLEARFAGAGKDGSPVCAGIKLPEGWKTL